MQTVIDLIREFDQALEDSVGLYLDAEAAMIQFAMYLDNQQSQTSKQLNIPLAQLEAIPFSYGHSDPNDPNSIHLHAVSQGDLKARNVKGGKNHVLMGQRFLVDIYTFWEDGYRSRIADALGISRNAILADIFGDIRLLRISIIHHRGIALPAVENCKILTWFKEGDMIDVSNSDRFQLIVVQTRAWLERFGLEKTGSSPGITGRWGPSGHRHI